MNTSNPSSINLKTRREFLRTTILGGALTWSVPYFVSNTFAALHAAAMDSSSIATGKDSPILVILFLGGGNDGLNTIVPYTNDHYYKARPVLAIKKDKALKINDEYGFHPSLAGFKSLYDGGDLGIIPGVGYPAGAAVRSHFAAASVWHQANPGEATSLTQTTGWIGRYLDSSYQGNDPTIGINLARQKPELFMSNRVRTITLTDVDNYKFGSKKGATNKDVDRFYADQIGAVKTAVSGDSAVGYLEQITLDAQVSSDSILARVSKVENKAKYPDSEIAKDLSLIGRLIAGGLPTRVYYAQQAGYDTHARQAETQSKLLEELSQGMKAFRDDLKAQGNFNRVLTVVFSEFGRRVQENGAQGTDHGKANYVFLMGGDKIKHGVLGEHPSIAPNDLVGGDTMFKVDFRAMYAEILAKWLKAPSIVPIVGEKFHAGSIIMA